MLDSIEQILTSLWCQVHSAGQTLLMKGPFSGTSLMPNFNIFAPLMVRISYKFSLPSFLFTKFVHQCVKSIKNWLGCAQFSKILEWTSFYCTCLKVLLSYLDVQRHWDKTYKTCCTFDEGRFFSLFQESQSVQPRFGWSPGTSARQGFLETRQ